MARKGNQQKNGVDRQTSNHKKSSHLENAVPDVKGHGEVSEAEVFPGEELPNGNHPSSPQARSTSKTNNCGDEHKGKQKPKKQPKKDKKGMNGMSTERQNSSGIDLGDCNSNSNIEGPNAVEENVSVPHCDKGRNRNRNHRQSRVLYSLNGLHIQNMLESIGFSDNAVVRSLKAWALSAFKAVNEWLEKQRPLFITLRTKLQSAHVYAKTKIECTLFSAE